MLQTAEDLAGPYVWGQYDLLVLPPSFPYGGMENPCLTFVTPTLLVSVILTKIQLFLRACSSVKWWMLIYRLLIFPPRENSKFFCPLWSSGIMHGTVVSGVYWVLLELTTTLSYLVFFFFLGRWSISIKCKCSISSCLQAQHRLNLHLSFVMDVWKLSLLFIGGIKS